MQKQYTSRASQTTTLESVDRDTWDAEQLHAYCNHVLQSTFRQFRETEVQVSFYPYIGLTHTLRRTNKGWILRISDHCRHAPELIMKSIVLILGYKVLHRKPPRRFLEIYDRFRSDPELDSLVRKRREIKGRKLFSNHTGKHHCLQKIYGELNEKYFNCQIDIQRIGWGRRRGQDRLGHYDPIHHTIMLSPVLDSPDVPSFVVRYIVYHEMLHAVFGINPRKSFQRHHPREFRHAESSYPDYSRAREFLKGFNRKPK